ncbi:MAG: restriction endonuclease subunit S [Nitrospirae bacterium]|nr:restriction endonuclease subunit S [Nitrospirota bacterium]
MIETSLGTVAYINPSSIGNNYSYKEIEYIDISSVESGVLLGTTHYQISDAPSRAKRLVSHGDTILSTVRPNRRSFLFIKNPASNLVVSTGFAVLRASDKIAPKFLYYLVTNQPFTDYLTANAKGAAYPAVDTEIIARARIYLPDRPEQHKIASILSAYDDLIENNLRRIKILEEMAQIIYREWFVRFRFPGYEKVKMVKIPIETHCNASLQNRIPEGWEVKKASECIEINPRIKVDKDNSKPYVNMAGLSETSMIIQCNEFRTGSNGSKYQNGDTLFARITPCLENGKTGFVQFLNEDDVGIGSTEFIVLRSKGLSPEFVYLLSRTDDFRNNAIKSMTGASGRQRVQIECFDKYQTAKPDKKIINKFTEIVRPMFQSIHRLDLKNNILSKTCDLLLPKLISGEIDVEGMGIDVQ